jgi:predicted TPR repeat methyltransferase
LKPLDLSSGDLLADRRADYAEMLFASSDHVAAAELMLAALDLAPGWAIGWFRLGEMHEAAGAIGEAAEAWRMTLRLDPADRAGAALKLELIGAAPFSAAPPSPFVEALFDQCAGAFDASLVQKLDYRVPERLDRAIRAQREHFGHAIDLGCGTGLMGEKLRPVAAFLEGCDISAAMLKKAEAKHVYDRLEKVDLQTVDLPPASADLIAAADVFMYLGALDGIFPKVASALRPGGLFACSVEHHVGPEDFMLRASRRYAHSQAYVHRLLDRGGFSVTSTERAAIRMDRGEAIEGVIVVAERLQVSCTSFEVRCSQIPV